MLNGKMVGGMFDGASGPAMGPHTARARYGTPRHAPDSDKSPAFKIRPDLFTDINQP